MEYMDMNTLIQEGRQGSKVHAHRWRIDEAHGPVSLGRCICGAEREFKNWLADTDFITNEEHRVLALI